MNIKDFNGRLAPWAIFAADLCREAYGNPDLLAVRAAMQVLGDGPIDIKTRPLSGGVPATMLCTGPESAVVAISGLTNLFQALSINLGWENPSVGETTNDFCGFFFTAAEALSQALNLRRILDGRTLYLFGHSAGGGIALALAAKWRPVIGAAQIHVVTFGSPRAATEKGNARTAGIEVTRWMNDDDDVPVLPPRLTDLSDVAFLTNVLNVPLWARFVHGDGGLLLRLFGRPIAAVDPEPHGVLGYPNWPISYLRTGAVFGTPHAITEYIRRLSNQLPSSLPIKDPKVHGGFDTASIPTIFKIVQGDNGLSLPIPYAAGVEREVPAAQVQQLVLQRQRFITEPIKRC